MFGVLAAGVGIGIGLDAFKTYLSGGTYSDFVCNVEESVYTGTELATMLYSLTTGYAASEVSELEKAGNERLAELYNTQKADWERAVKNSEGGSKTIVVQYGDEFGKMGRYVENPQIKVDWTEYAEHAAERMQQRGMTRELIDHIVGNGKVLSQNGGNKYVYITQEGVAVVSKEGKLIIGWTSSDYDEAMIEIVNKLFGE